MNRIKLFKGIMVLTLISIFALPGYIVFYVAPATTAFVKKDSEEMATRIAAHIAPQIMDLDGDDHYSITREDIETLERIHKDFETYKIKIYDAEGVVIYSTNEGDIGIKNNRKYFHEEIEKGNTYAVMLQKGNRTMEGKLVPLNVVETYVPIMVEGKFIGAFEMYFDITEQMVNQNRLLSKYYRTSVPIAACMLLAVIAAFITVRKTERDIKELLDTLEARVENRTAELVERENQLSSLTQKLITSQEEERARIAREMHDELGQQLTGMQLVIGKLSEQDVPDIEHINMLGDCIEEATQEVRRICKGLRPMVLDKMGLSFALNALVEEFRERSEIEIVHVSSQVDELDIPGKVSIIFYRVFQEILHNIIKHSGAGRVSSSFEKKGSVLILRVSDDGKGFNMEEMSTDGRLGILGMRERATLCGGTLKIDSGTGRGTSIIMQVKI